MKVLDVAENSLWQQLPSMTCILVPYLNSAPPIPYSLYTSYNKSSLPSTRHCTWPLFIWKLHSIMCTDMSSGGLFPSLVLRSVQSIPNKSCIKCQEQSAGWLQSEWRIQCWSIYGSGGPLPRVAYRISLRKHVCRLPVYHLWIAGGTSGEADPIKVCHGR